MELKSQTVTQKDGTQVTIILKQITGAYPYQIITYWDGRAQGGQKKKTLTGAETLFSQVVKNFAKN
jgi:hypothetical protein